jgi:putative redox protein
MSAIATVKAVLEDTPYLVSFTDDLGHTWKRRRTHRGRRRQCRAVARKTDPSGLGACTAITIKMASESNGAHRRGSRRANPDGKPAAGNDIVRRITLQGDLNDEQRAQLLKVANACPMHKLLSGEIRIHSELQA